MSCRFVQQAAIVTALISVGSGQAQTGGDDPYEFLRRSDVGYAEVVPEYVIEFPRDHGGHPQFRVEWWYITANLEGAQGEQYGVQWTLFRQSLTPGDEFTGDASLTDVDKQWQSNQLWLAHAAISSAKQHEYWQKVSRGGIGQAGVETGPFTAWIDHWSLASVSDQQNDFYPLELVFTGEKGGFQFSVDLELTADVPMVLNGKDGYSQKSTASQASYYYSQPMLKTQGQIVWKNQVIDVTGEAWLDREWSSQPLADNQTGWDWFGLHLDDGRALMVYQIREKTASDQSNSTISGSLIASDGSKTNVRSDDLQLKVLATEEISGRSLPLRWHLLIPKSDIELTIEPLHANQFIDGVLPYWEGVVFAKDRDSNQQVGRGYMELMGY